ncbi:ChuX/HutX family heme-like substrate-binding protein [Labrys sp. La1]|uniref:ChuX/HutX family heme-like substrate-binding protein n=1 Tax=Labrys sp. La1 TaxID=3404917 RepID=UPI003EB70649
MSELKQRWQALRESQSGLRIRDAAAQLGVSEAALLETRIDEGARRLAVRVDALCAALPHLGTVMSLIRNESAVHEKDVAFPAGAESDGEIRFAGEGFSLTLIPSSVAHAFYVEDANPKGPLRSIQLFDAAGGALWKIYARDKADHAAFERLLAELAWPDGVQPIPFSRPASASTDAAPAGNPTDLQAVLEAAAAEAIPVRLEVANHGVRQSHRGPLARIVRMGPWLNVLDPGFDWHLNEKPLSGGSIELGDRPILVLHLASGGEAARLQADDGATADQQASWRGILEKAVTS